MVLAIAAFLRLYAIDTIDLRYDEASAAQFALSISQGHLLPVAPFSGSVANHPPVYLYVLAIPYLFTKDLLVIASYRALLDVAAIALVWTLCLRYYNRRIATLATLFFAVAPWAVQFARKLWLAPLPLFSVILLYGLLEVTRRRNPWGWAIAGWGIALSIGTHLSAIYLAPVVLIVLAMNWRTVRLMPALIGVIPFIILGGIYLQFDAANGFANINALLSSSRQTGAFSLDSATFAIWISGGTHLSDLTGGAYSTWAAQLPAALNALDQLQVGLLCVGVVYLIICAADAVTHRTWIDLRVNLVLLCWMLIPILLQMNSARAVQIHYLAPLYPVPFILMALPLDRFYGLLRAKPTGTARVLLVVPAFICIGAVLIWQIYTTFRFDHFVMENDTSRGGYGQPVRAAMTMASISQSAMCDSPVCSTLNDAPNDVIVITPGGDPLVNEQATIMNVVLAGISHRFDNSDAGLIYPAGPAQYIITPGAEHVLDRLLSGIDAGRVHTETIPIRPGYSLGYTYVSTSDPVRNDYLTAPRAQWGNGVSLLGYKANVDVTLRLDVFLRVDSLPAPGSDFHWYNHVIDQGKQVAQADGGGISAMNWRSGDILVQWFLLSLPQPPPVPPYEVRIGSYLYPAIQTVPVMLTNGSVEDGVNLVIKK